MVGTNENIIQSCNRRKHNIKEYLLRLFHMLGFYI